MDTSTTAGNQPAPASAAHRRTWLDEVRRPDRTAAFESPQTCWSVRGTVREVRADAVDEEVRRHFDRHDDDVVLAARPFAEDIPAVLVSGAAASPAPEEPPVAPGVVDLDAARVHPSREGFEARVAMAVRAMRAAPSTGRAHPGHRLEKVVLGRRILLPLAAGTSPEAAAGRLLRGLRTGRGGYTFSIPLRHGGALVGHSPELLLRRSGTAVETCPLAGSAPRTGDTVRDGERREHLLASAKDRREHHYVVEAVTARLAEVCTSVDAPPSPRVFETETMLHLGTPIRGTLPTSGAPGVFALAELLHPTPAVCGTPTGRAREVIAAIEEPRGYFTGVVGWQDRDGDGETALAIRCAEVTPVAVEVYAGAGVISESDPAAEADETHAKMRTVLRALGAEEVMA